MNYRNYKKGYSALRHIINDEETQFARQFASFHFSMRERYSERTQLRGIYNVKTNNIVAFVNKKGNVFIRPQSVYAEHLIKGSKNKVIRNSNLRSYRGHVSNSLKRDALANLYGELSAERLEANMDSPNKVFLCKLDDNISIEPSRFQRTIVKWLDKDKFKNTLYSLKESNLLIERRPEDSAEHKHRVYLQVNDYAEQIAREERLERVKNDVANMFLGNIREIARDSISRGETLNPIQFTYKMNDGEEVTGRINLNRVNLAYPENIPMSDWLPVDDLKRYIVFSERVGSLAERGIDEMEHRIRQDMVNLQAQAYQDYLRYNMSPGATIRVPRMENVEWFASTADTGDFYGSNTTTVSYDEVSTVEDDSALWGSVELERPF